MIPEAERTYISGLKPIVLSSRKTFDHSTTFYRISLVDVFCLWKQSVNHFIIGLNTHFMNLLVKFSERAKIL